ncbi:NADPH oxidase 2-like [Amphiura filiformis]|uniref:NADPH oxidase 2-like n=1 Tax=Amphiura filiformis TaxID=82378 RepID=UPI003B21E967
MMGDSFINNGLTYLFLLLWFAANVGYFTVVYLTYESDTYYYIRFLIGPGLPIAKACGATLNLNSMLILLPVCRNLISFFRGSCKTNQLCRRSVRRQLDSSLSFHKFLAYFICVLSITHTIAHFFNFRILFDHYRNVNQDRYGNNAALADVLRDENFTYPSQNWINPIQASEATLIAALPYQTPKLIADNLALTEQGLIQIAGWSGVVLCLVLIFMFSSATEFIRRSYFETFWITHHLFVLYFAMIVVHGAGGIIRSQTNLDKHDVAYCKDIPDDWGIDSRCDMPMFADGSPASWKWCVGPICLYILERCIRFIRSIQKVTITKVVKHPSKVLELQMKKKGFNSLPGQYIFLKCPSISHVQWHPFTLTSCPEEDHFSVHIRTVGDWTNDLAKAMGSNKASPVEPENLPRVAVDGPLGTASIDIFKYQAAICVGAGIGVTPFASILKSIWLKSVNNEAVSKLKRVYFFWICRDTDAFEWFSEMLEDIESHMIEQGRGDFLKYNIYLTRGWTHNQAKNLYLHGASVKDTITGLQQKTQYGRPQWDTIFTQIGKDHPGTSVGVFFCGPEQLSNVLEKKSNEHSNISGNGAKFFFNKENF